MNKSKITIEYDECCKKKRVEKSKKTGARTTRTMEYVDVKDPKCWEVITVENTIAYTPGHRLTEKQVKRLCSSAKYDVVIGMPGQYRIGSRY